MSSQYGELRPTSSWDLLASLGNPWKFQRVSRLGSVTARHSSSERQPNFAALNRGRHLYSAGRPSRWALAHMGIGPHSGFQWIRVVRSVCCGQVPIRALCERPFTISTRRLKAYCCNRRHIGKFSSFSVQLSSFCWFSTRQLIRLVVLCSF